MLCLNTKWVFPDSKPDGQLVPCGKCLACLTNKRAEWSFRLQEEYKRSKSAAFITLTYHPKFVPDTGVSKRHFQLFMKRLRKKSGERLRYYAVGEYGSKTGRPHYHAIIFNYQGNEKFLESIWPFGIVHIGKVNQRSIMYTLKYVIQSKVSVSSLVAKPFSLMSRGFGLGAFYLTDEMVRWHRDGLRNFTFNHGVKGRLPRYYRDKIWPSTEFKSLQTDWKQIRTDLSETAKQELEKAYQKNVNLLKELGYSDPDKIIAEMRSAVYSRIKQKVAFTQTL